MFFVNGLGRRASRIRGFITAASPPNSLRIEVFPAFSRQIVVVYCREESPSQSPLRILARTATGPHRAKPQALSDKLSNRRGGVGPADARAVAFTPRAFAAARSPTAAARSSAPPEVPH